MWHTVKFGLVLYIIAASQNQEEAKSLYQLFTTCIPGEVQKEILEEEGYDKLRSFTKEHEKQKWMYVLRKNNIYCLLK